jgi:hypothetical protein
LFENNVHLGVEGFTDALGRITFKWEVNKIYYYKKNLQMGGPPWLHLFRRRISYLGIVRSIM